MNVSDTKVSSHKFTRRFNVTERRGSLKSDANNLDLILGIGCRRFAHSAFCSSACSSATRYLIFRAFIRGMNMAFVGDMIMVWQVAEDNVRGSRASWTVLAVHKSDIGGI